MVTPPVVVRMNTRVAEPRSVPEERPATSGHITAEFGPADDGATPRGDVGDVVLGVAGADRAPDADRPGEAAASPKYPPAAPTSRAVTATPAKTCWRRRAVVASRPGRSPQSAPLTGSPPP